MSLANTILIIHFLFVFFVVGGLPVIWVGAWLRLNFVRNIWLRVIHLTAILFVVGESLFGVVCPLTIWEDKLRQLEPDGSFIQRWLHRILFYDLPEDILTIAYLLFAILIVATFILIPPYRRNTPI
ncbi:MAG: DUF2784 domain-containing protein [Nitrosomonadales bacterium]|nr:MAG: DUF2784 domain-containing protein [Nitrosomonadales bacterium]